MTVKKEEEVTVDVDALGAAWKRAKERVEEVEKEIADFKAATAASSAHMAEMFTRGYATGDMKTVDAAEARAAEVEIAPQKLETLNVKLKSAKVVEKTAQAQAAEAAKQALIVEAREHSAALKDILEGAGKILEEAYEAFGAFAEAHSAWQQRARTIQLAAGLEPRQRDLPGLPGDLHLCNFLHYLRLAAQTKSLPLYFTWGARSVRLRADAPYRGIRRGTKF